jgi:hypothetical protein
MSTDSKPPISEKRLAANRENAQRSTGPRTPEGRARSSRNAVKHGFRASSFAVVRLEDLDEVEKLKADAVACYRPVNSQELVAVERIAMAQQQIFRGGRLDAGMFTSALNDVLDRTNNPILPMDPDMVGDGDIEITRVQNRNYCIAEGFRRIAKESNAIGLMLRYRAQAEREYRRAVEDFDRLKALRHEMPNEPNVGVEPDDETEDIVPIEELNWELKHLRWQKPNEANAAVPNEPKPGLEPAEKEQLPPLTDTSAPPSTPSGPAQTAQTTPLAPHTTGPALVPGVQNPPRQHPQGQNPGKEDIAA